jgi:uncharacterized damage-inducible protein DinB
MKPTEPLSAHNIVYLEQSLDLLDTLDDDAYTANQPPYHQSSIGDHLRHCLEHYTSFLDGLDDGAIDYDARARDARIATSRLFATQVIRDLIERLEALPQHDQPVRVKMDCDKDAESADPWSASSVKRELQYLLAHTIHHYALIAMLLRLQGRMPHPDFGVAPSTLKHRRRQEAAA